MVKDFQVKQGMTHNTNCGYTVTINYRDGGEETTNRLFRCDVVYMLRSRGASDSKIIEALNDGIELY